MIGRNEGGRLVSAVAAAQRDCDRVVYVDSQSSDGSAARVQALGATVVALDDSQPLTAARGRRAGLERLLGDWPDCRFVQFVDGDCILQPGWIGQAVAFLESNSGVAAVCGRRFEAHPDRSLYNRLIDREWATPVGQADACGGDAMMRIEALTAVGSFRAELRAGEEPELCARMRARGWEVWRIDAPMTEHDAGIDRFSQWWGRAERGGFGYAQVWMATNGLSARLYGRHMASALLWAVVLPVTAIAVAAAIGAWTALLAVPAILAVQLLRIAMRRDDRRFGERFQAAAVTMVIKFAEAKGVLRFLLGLGGATTTYKMLPTHVETGRA